MTSFCCVALYIDSPNASQHHLVEFVLDTVFRKTRYSECSQWAEDHKLHLRRSFYVLTQILCSISWAQWLFQFSADKSISHLQSFTTCFYLITKTLLMRVLFAQRPLPRRLLMVLYAMSTLDWTFSRMYVSSILPALGNVKCFKWRFFASLHICTLA